MNNAIASQDINILIQTADFAVKYGFLAIGLLLIFLIAPAIFKFGQAKLLALVSASFGLAFVVAFGALDLAARMSGDRTLLSGTVLGMTNGFAVQVRSDIRQAGQAYTKREVDPENGSVFNFPFLLATRDQPGCLVVSIASTDPSSDRIFAFNIAPLTTEDMRADTQVVVQVVPGEGDRMGLNVWREQGQKRLGDVVALEPLPETEQDCSRGGAVTAWWQGLAGAAFAQGVPPDLANRLQSDDAFTRRDARIELSGQGAAAFGTIAELLASGTGRLQAGGLVALGGMAPDQLCGAPDDLWVAVQALSGTGDAAVQEAAAQALGARGGC